MSNKYITDITHYLDETGELAEMPRPARQLASFLVLLIDATTRVVPAHDYDTQIRCRGDGCTGSICTSLPSMNEDIYWYCPDCEQHGIIRNWQGTKWSQENQG